MPRFELRGRNHFVNRKASNSPVSREQIHITMFVDAEQRTSRDEAYSFYSSDESCLINRQHSHIHLGAAMLETKVIQYGVS